MGVTVTFRTVMNFGHFLGPPRLRPSTISRTMEVGARKESQGEIVRERRTKKRRKQQMEENQDKQKENNKKRHWGRDKQYSPCFLEKTSPAEGRRRFHKNTAYGPFRFSGVQVFRCSGVWVFWKVKRETGERAPKWSKLKMV